MNYKELTDAFRENEIVFRGALVVLLTHGAATLSQPNAKERYKVSGNIIDPELQRDMLDLACRMAATDFGLLMAFVKREMAFRIPAGANQTEEGEEGTCPVCSGGLEYKGWKATDDFDARSWTCQDCGATGEEVFTRIFQHHSDVCLKNGLRASMQAACARDDGEKGGDKEKDLCGKCTRRITQRDGISVLDCACGFAGVSKIADEGRIVLACDDFEAS